MYHLVEMHFDIGIGTYGVPDIHHYDDTTRLTIGKYCSIASGVQIILGGNHHTKWVSTYAFYQEQKWFPNWCDIGENSINHGDIVIGNDVWVGRDVLILPGANIGDGAVIGAGAVVTGKILPYTISVGNSAKVIKNRFTENQIADLLHIKWWDWSVERISYH